LAINTTRSKVQPDCTQIASVGIAVVQARSEFGCCGWSLTQALCSQPRAASQTTRSKFTKGHRAAKTLATAGIQAPKDEAKLKRFSDQSPVFIQKAPP